MAGPPSTPLEAIVLGGVDYGEADRIVDLLTASRGRVKALARGARRASRRFSGALDATLKVEVMIRRGRGELELLDAADVLEGRGHLRGDLDGIVLATYACEVMSALARQEQPEPRLYGLLDVALLLLDGVTERPSPTFRMAFEAKALTFAGLAPVLDRCLSCGQSPSDEPIVYSPEAGGLLHRRCGGGAALTPADAALLESARRSPLADLVDAPAPGCSTSLFYDHLRWHVGRALRSWPLLARLEGQGSEDAGAERGPPLSG